MVDALANELRDVAVVGGDGGGKGATIEDLPVHLRHHIACDVAQHKLDEGPPPPPPPPVVVRVAVLEDNDIRSVAKVGEECVEVRVREGVVNVRNVQC